MEFISGGIIHPLGAPPHPIQLTRSRFTPFLGVGDPSYVTAGLQLC